MISFPVPTHAYVYKKPCKETHITGTSFPVHTPRLVSWLTHDLYYFPCANAEMPRHVFPSSRLRISHVVSSSPRNFKLKIMFSTFVFLNFSAGHFFPRFISTNRCIGENILCHLWFWFVSFFWTYFLFLIFSCFFFCFVNKSINKRVNWLSVGMKKADVLFSLQTSSLLVD